MIVLLQAEELPELRPTWRTRRGSSLLRSSLSWRRASRLSRLLSPGPSTGSQVGRGGGTQRLTLHLIFSVVADLLQNESVTTLVQKRKEKQGEDSGLESGHTSMNAASDTQSDSNSGAEDSLHSPNSTHSPDIVRTSQQIRNTDFGGQIAITFKSFIGKVYSNSESPLLLEKLTVTQV